MSGGAGGPNLYHSNYDSFQFYEQFVDPEFKMGPMIEQLAGLMALRLANGNFIPYNLNKYPADLKMHFNTATLKIKKYHPEFEGFQLVTKAIEELEKSCDRLTNEIKFYLIKNAYSKKNVSKWNKQLIALEKSFISEKGMYFGSWYKSLYASSDPFSGYAAWILPGLEYEIAIKSSTRFKEWESRYANAINSLNEKMKRISTEIETN
jgi:N-acetylated-alpha-linked acidic dipeptidase